MTNILHRNISKESQTLKKAHSVAFWVSALWLIASPARAADWNQWGRSPDRNMTSPEKGLPTYFDPGRLDSKGEEIVAGSTRNIAWVVKLGSQTYGNPTISGGRVFVGTNNASPRQPSIVGDRGILMSFDEATGAFQWQLSVLKLGAGKVSDWEYLGVCSSPSVDGNRLFAVTNRAEVVALDALGLSNGNQGPFMNEGKYSSTPGQPEIKPGSTSADIVWRFDMRQEIGIFPHNIASSSVLVVGDRIYANTSNGVDWSHRNIPTPSAPSLIVLDKKTGALLGEENSGISKRLLHGNWSSPSYGKVGRQEMVFFGAGDGYCYGFDPTPAMNEEGFDALKELWRFDANPQHYREKDGKKVRYTRHDGPSEIIATPVFHDGRVYVAIGQDPEHGPGAGNLSCIDASKRGDITKSGKVWSFEGIGRSISTVAIHKGLVFATDLNGKVYCFDAKKGTLHWTHDTDSRIWASPIVADNKLYIGNEDGVLTVLAASRKKALLHRANFPSPLYGSIVAANKALYVSTQTHLYKLVDMGQMSKPGQ